MKLLLAGFVLSLLGSLPPGLINLSVAYIAIRRSFFAAMALGAGAAYIVASAADRVVLWLEPEQNAELTSSGDGEHRSSKKSNLQRWWR